MTILISAITILLKVIDAKLPIVQNSIVANSLIGSAIYLKIMIPASAKADMTMPARI